MSYNKIQNLIKYVGDRTLLKNILNYEGISLWWFYGFGLFYLLEDYMKNKKAGNKNALKIVTSKFISKFAKYHLPSNFANYCFISKAITRFTLNKIINEQIKNKQSENRSTYKVLAVSYTGYWKNYPTPQKENKKANRDAMLGDIITALQNKNFNVIAVDANPEIFIDFKTMIEKRIQEKGLWRPIETYLTADIIRKTFKAAKNYKEEWDKLKNNKGFIESLNYDGIQLHELLKIYFEEIFKYTTFSPVLDIELMKRAIEVEKPDLVLITCGYCQLGRAAVIAGKLKRVQTLEIQHGVIHPNHFYYIFSRDENFAEDNVKSPYCPLPNKTAVYGNYHKDLLTKMSTYPEDSVVVTGQPRYDFLDDADKIYSREEFIKRYNIDQNHKIILWATAFHGLKDEENIKDFNAVFNAIRGTKNTTLIIKPHPRDEKRHINMIKHYLSDYKISAVIAPRSSDTYEQIFACDLMITRGSTTGMEAIALNKPVIVLNLTGKPGAIDYVEQGVALGVYKAEDLKPTIEKLLRDDSAIAKNRERYIENYLYKTDGKATERVVNVIEEMIKESRSDKNEKTV